MAHPQQLKFIELVNNFFVNQQRASTTPFKILEIGSFDVNGSPRSFLQDVNTEYVGVDLCEGKGVDIVSFGHSLTLPTDSVDFVLSCECFEHDPHWLDTFKNMYRMAKPGAVVAFTCASKGRLEHGTRRTLAEDSPGTQFVGLDYYKNLTGKDFYNQFNLNDLFTEHFFFYEKSSQDLYFVGQKIGGKDLIIEKDLFFKAVSRIEQLSKFRPKIFQIPVSIARLLLSEENFQNFSIAYLNKVKPIRKFFRSLSI